MGSFETHLTAVASAANPDGCLLIDKRRNSAPGRGSRCLFAAAIATSGSLGYENKADCIRKVTALSGRLMTHEKRKRDAFSEKDVETLT